MADGTATINQMIFTGERFVPEVKGSIQYEHLHRYALCLNYVAGKDVLDIASGEGYGSALMASLAKTVVGVDVEPSCAKHASARYSPYKNLRFLEGACSAIPLAVNSVDVVIVETCTPKGASAKCSRFIAVSGIAPNTLQNMHSVFMRLCCEPFDKVVSRFEPMVNVAHLANTQEPSPIGHSCISYCRHL